MKKGLICTAVACWLAAFAGGALGAPGDNPAALFPQLDGWQKKGECESYSADTLYEYIDGAAENFISYGCQRLLVQNYASGRGQVVSAEIYFHGNVENAFGMYASEKPLAGNYLALGGQGYAEAGVLNFFCAACYVKLSAFDLEADDGAVLRTLGQAIAAAIDPAAAMPDMLRIFPNAGKVAHTERFILNNFMGHDFLRAAYTADYQVNGETFRLFVLDAGSEASARAVLEKYVALERDKPAPAIIKVQLTITDPYNGPVRLLWQGRYICGSDGRTPAAAEGIAALARNLPQP